MKSRGSYALWPGLKELREIPPPRPISNSAFEGALAHPDHTAIILRAINPYRGSFSNESLWQFAREALWEALRKHDFSFETAFTTSLYRWTKIIVRRALFEDSKATSESLKGVDLAREDSHLRNIDQEDALMALLSHLKPRTAWLVRQQYVMGRTPDEIATRLGLPKEAVTRRLDSALSQLSRVVPRPR